MTRQDFHLVIIDPQNDFCDLPAAYCPVDPHSGASLSPALPVAGAHADMLRLAELIRLGGQGLSEIAVTLDSHQHLDIAHPTFWQDAAGLPVAPFTQISAAELRAGKYLPRVADARSRAQAYLDALEAAGRYTHMVWPVHCEIGTWGHNIHHDLRLACNHWEETHAAIVAKLVKGTNPWTEHYSAIMAEVPDAKDASTQLNAEFIARLRTADRIYIAGEAASHCVKATTEHIVENIGAAHLAKLVLIEDCMSPVGGFETQQAAFFSDMRARGLRIATAAEITAELQHNPE